MEWGRPAEPTGVHGVVIDLLLLTHKTLHGTRGRPAVEHLPGTRLWGTTDQRIRETEKHRIKKSTLAGGKLFAGETTKVQRGSREEENILMVDGRKRTREDHFDRSAILRQNIRPKGGPDSQLGKAIDALKGNMVELGEDEEEEEMKELNKGTPLMNRVAPL